jgi:predicted DNA-binding transcriptional regulator AlpA
MRQPLPQPGLPPGIVHISRPLADVIEPLLARADLARVLATSLRSLDRMAAAGKLPRPDLYLGVRQPRWRAETIRRWIDGGCDATH